MKAIFEGESLHRKGNYDISDHKQAFGPFQLNVAGNRLGAQFQREMGKDPSKPETLQDQADWVAKHFKRSMQRGGNADSSGVNIPLSGGAAARGRESSIGHMQPGFRTSLSASFKAAQDAGLHPTVSSGYRSEATQQALRICHGS